MFSLSGCFCAPFLDSPRLDSLEIEQICDQCLAPDPTTRPTACSVASDADWLGFVSDAVIAYVAVMNGDTDELQPLDRPVCGAMKATFRRLFDLALRESRDRRIGTLEAMQILPRIWDDLSLASIGKGWSISDDFGPDAPWEP
jgi:hypothetical protein